MDTPSAFPPKFSSVLVTPDPHYIPGYAGYCPQLKYNMGQTYGQLTARLLTGPEIRHSTKLVLHTGRLITTGRLGLTAEEPDRTAEEEMLWTTHPYIGEHRTSDMIPGYTGFVPKRHKYFAQTYAKTCRQALADFSQDQKSKVQLRTAVVPVVAYRNPAFKVNKLNTPLNTGRNELTPPKIWTPLGSPYLMEEGSPHKYYISGFTGYVPKSRFLIGRGYPATTNEALILLGREWGRSVDDQRRKSTTLPPIQGPRHAPRTPS
ncbi:hypothetical protein NHX12_026880 [Muraenolepis orangiensis]|uniref:Ciliary microtubule inner protein 2B n=1 Tax=Muraenolepis orangiensis TaxID=630683 RepID=A0A9Q0INQ4_9TELE|nr:hypothetical protein NHX12_026880 [Muraenolepis orangiensis]